MYLLNNYIVKTKAGTDMKNYADNSSYQTQPHSTTVTVAHTCKKNSSIREFLISCLEKSEKTIKVKISFVGLTFCNSDLLLTVYVAYNNSFSTSFPAVSNFYLVKVVS